MFTEAEARKAISTASIKELERKIALTIHKAAVKMVSECSLPYRVCLDYLKADRDRDEVPINPYYPLPGIPDEFVWHYDTDGGYSRDEWFRILLTPTGEVTEDGKAVVTIKKPDYIRQQEEEKAKPCRLWNLETDAGREQWLYHFAVFLLPYEGDIPNWKAFDLWGDTNHTEQEQRERKRYYMELIARCRECPESYNHNVAMKGEQDNDRNE